MVGGGRGWVVVGGVKDEGNEGPSLCLQEQCSTKKENCLLINMKKTLKQEAEK